MSDQEYLLLANEFGIPVDNAEALMAFGKEVFKRGTNYGREEAMFFLKLPGTTPESVVLELRGLIDGDPY